MKSVPPQKAAASGKAAVEGPAEGRRLAEDARREKNWKRFGPYLSERQWGTVREDYSADGTPWEYFPHEHARSRAYRWGEDGLLGITDREGRLCFAPALWNGSDPILKERLFGLTGPQGNHGEDVKELYFYLDSTPTHSYMTAWCGSFSPTGATAVPATGGLPGSPRIRPGAICSFSTSTSTQTRAGGRGRATRPAGPPSS